MNISQIRQIVILFSFLRKGKKNVLFWALVLLLNFLASLLEGGSFAAIFFGFSYLTNESTPTLAIFSGLSTYQMFALCIMGAIVLQVLRSSIAYVSQVMASWFAVTIQREVQESIFKRIFSFSFSEVRQMKMGDLMEMSISPLKFIRQVMDGLNRLLVSLMMAIGYVVLMAYLSLPLTGSILVLFALAVVWQKLVFKKIAKASEKQTKREVDLSTSTAQTLEGMKEIHLFHCHHFILGAINKALKKLSKSSFKLDLWSYCILPVNEMATVLLVGLTILLGLFFLKEGNVPLTSALLTFMTLTYRLGTRLQLMMQASSDVVYYIGTISRVHNFLSSNQLPALPFTEIVEPMRWQEISLHGVSFRYAAKQEFVLNNLSFSIQRGEVVAIVGHSGAGKSTLIDLLLRLYEPTKGELLLDDRPAASISLENYRALFAVVAQDAFLFHSSIAENISFGGESVDLAAVITAAKKAHAHGFISKLPDGYHTLIGAGGHRLSGGEKQRIALARALYRNSDILILDEATSHLDSLSEKFIQQTIKELKGEKTIIMVAHRLSTVVHADKIIVLEQGSIVESGTHRELVGQEGSYQNFWALQEMV